MLKVDTERTLVFGCLHSPYHDEDAYDTMLNFIKYWKPNRIISNGDGNDLWNVSKYFKNPERKDNLAYEFEIGRETHGRLRKAAGKNCEIVYNFGNHCARYDLYLQTEAAELVKQFGLEEQLRFENVFGLTENKIIPNRGKLGTYARFSLGRIVVGHFPVARKHSADTEQALVNDGGITVITSHSHRKGVYYKTLMDGTVLQGMGTGHLCDESKADYVEGANWQQGFVLVEKLTAKDRYHLTDMPIVGGDILYDGRLF